VVTVGGVQQPVSVKSITQTNQNFMDTKTSATDILGMTKTVLDTTTVNVVAGGLANTVRML
jgi:hypothetical protein